MPLALIRPISGSGATGILTEILNNYGADSEVGRIASVIMGSTETTFYCLCVYFAKTRVKHNLKAVPFAAVGDIVGIIDGGYFVKVGKILTNLIIYLKNSNFYIYIIKKNRIILSA